MLDLLGDGAVKNMTRNLGLVDQFAVDAKGHAAHGAAVAYCYGQGKDKSGTANRVKECDAQRGAIGHVVLIKAGDRIEIDIPKRRLILRVDAAALHQRRVKWTPRTSVLGRGYVARYASIRACLQTGVRE